MSSPNSTPESILEMKPDVIEELTKGLAGESIEESQQINTDKWHKIPTFKGLLRSPKPDLNYSKLYEQEKSNAKELSDKLEDIYGRIQDAARKLRSWGLGEALRQEYGQRDAQKAVRALIDEYEYSFKGCRKLAIDLRRSKEEKLGLEDRQRKQVKDLIEKHKKKVDDMEIERKKATQQLIADVARLESDKRNLVNGHKEQLHQLAENHDARISNMERIFSLEKGQMEREFNSTKSQMERNFNSEMGQMRRDFNITKIQMEREFDSQLDQMERNFNNTKTQMETNFEDEKSQLERDHAEEQARLRIDIQSLNGALVDRVHFKPLSDQDLKSRFSDFVDDIDYIARLEWKHNQTDWTDELLVQASKNQRKLKKHILQESIWIALYKNIFCSPFRVFGEEGRSLEIQWATAFGHDRQWKDEFYAWPEPSLDAERWRYENVKQGQKALEQPTSEFDPRHRLKMGFQSSIGIVKKELSEAIGKVSGMNNSTAQALEDIVMKAAKMWLEFGSQRCRIRVVMPGLDVLLPPSNKIRKAREDFLELVVVPKLQRFGNSNGLDLGKVETVAGCEGVTDRVAISNF